MDVFAGKKDESLKNKALHFTSYAILVFGLLAYGLKRYNGWDLNSYFNLAQELSRGTDVYGENLLSLYPPTVVFYFDGLNFLPKFPVHLGWYLLSLVLFFRLSRLAFSFWGENTDETALRNLVWYWISWVAILQGLAAQLEGGNINLLLIYFLVEGLNQTLKWRGDSRRLIWGIFLCWVPVLFKPYLGLVSAGLTLFHLKKGGLRVLLAPLLIVLFGLVPVLFRGRDVFVADFSNWLSSDLKHADCVLTLKCTAVNYGFPSYLYHIHHWSLRSLTLLTAFFSIVSLCYSFFEKNQVRLFCILSMICFCISPASFPYTLMLLWLPIVAGVRLILFEKKHVGFMTWFSGLTFILVLILFNPTYVGRTFFNQVIVVNRLTTFFVLLGVGVIFNLDWRRERDSNSR